MFNNRSKKGKKKVVVKEMLVADGRTQASIPNPSGLQRLNIPTVSMTLRYVCSTATTSTVTWANILDTVVFATSSTQVYDLFFAARLHSVEVWTPPAVLGVNASTQCTIAFDSPTQGDQRIWACSAAGGPGYVKATPSKHSLNGFTWQDSSAVGAFTFNNLPQGADIAINITFRCRMGQGAAQAAAQAASGASTGTIYFRGLDGLATASSKYNCVPASYQI